MSVRLNRGEFWLLAKAVEHNLPLWLLGLPEWPQVEYNRSIQAALDCRGHGMDTTTLKRTVQRLAARGWIRLALAVDDADESLAADDALLDEALHTTRKNCDFTTTVSILLTPTGGAVWEAFARPEWDLYVSDDCEDLGDGWYERCIVTGCEWMLKRYLHTLWLQQEWQREGEVRRMRRDWQPIYWKPPFSGFECRFRYREVEPPLGTYDNVVWWRRESGSHRQCWVSGSWCRWR